MKWVKWGSTAIQANGVSICSYIINGKKMFELWELPSKFIARFDNSNDAKKEAVAFVYAKQELSVSKDKPVGHDKNLGNNYSRSRG
jgi:hypothetical protein